jgi:phosphoribosyl-ATP pyrophosphohydrolase
LLGYRSDVTFEEMYALAISRKQEMPAGSATAELFRGGSHAIGKKLVEEAAESWMAARFESDADLAGELAQVLYYVACMMAENDISLEDVYRQL